MAIDSKGSGELKNRTEFVDILVDNTRSYKGKYHETICFAPEIYNLLCKLLESNNIDKKDRNIIASTIAYFILPKDVFPEEVFGTKGYIDDIYLCLHVLNYLEKKYEFEVLAEYWEEDLQILKNLLKKEYENLDKEFNYILDEMLDYIGLNFN